MKHKYHWLVFPLVLAFVTIAVAFAWIAGQPSIQRTRKPDRVQQATKNDRPRNQELKPKQSLVASLVNSVSTPKLTAEDSSYHYANSYQHSYSGDMVYRFETYVTNHTSKAIDEVYIYVRCKDPARTVPLTEHVKNVEIEGGIEPGETKIVSCDIPSAYFSGQKKEPIEVGVVDAYPPLYEKPYKHYKNPTMIVSDYVRRQDPIEKMLGL